MLPNSIKVYIISSINFKMNTYLFCTLMFILFMKSSYAASLYPGDQQPAVENDIFRRFSELNLVFGKTADKAATPVTVQDPTTDFRLDLIDGRNLTYMAAFVSKITSEVLCQGVVIDPLWIVTSALCLKKYSVSFEFITVLSGFQLPQVVVSEIKNVYMHPEFQILTNQNDLALVELTLPILNDAVIPVALTHVQDPTTNKCDFGAIYNYSMVAFHVDLVSPHDCMRSEIPKQKLYYYCAGVAGRQIELTEDDILGVPLVCGDQLYGIKSLTTIFTSIPAAYDWIISKIGHQPYRVGFNDMVHNFSPEASTEKPRPYPEENKKNESSIPISVVEDRGL